MDPLKYEIEPDGETMILFMPSGIALRLPREMALAIRDAISEALPEMAVKIN